jgi:FkbM family methyltransferase
MRRGDVVRDYGWIKLPYTGDGDLQEVEYHLNQADWHAHDESIFRCLVSPGSTVIDVGANMGFVSTMLASLVGPEGRVLAFEPSTHTVAKLHRVVELNDLDNVTVFNAGCGAVEEDVALHDVGTSSGVASIVGSGPVRETIRVLPLDEVPEARESRVSLIKIDTEGFEPLVLEGATELISEQAPALYIEMGGDYVDSTRRSIALLNELDYGIEHVRDVDWSQFGNGSNFFFLPRERSPVGSSPQAV